MVWASHEDWRGGLQFIFLLVSTNVVRQSAKQILDGVLCIQYTNLLYLLMPACLSVHCTIENYKRMSKYKVSVLVCSYTDYWKQDVLVMSDYVLRGVSI